MSLLGKRWQIYEQNLALCQSLSKELEISPVTAQVLLNRGISDVNEANKFLDPRLSYLSDPMDIQDMAKAAQRIFLARERGEKVVVYGDYDVDGVTGTVILLEVLEIIGIKSSYYIPHRYKEGYGMNGDAIKKIKNDGVALIITVDCGISNLVEIELANSLGIDVIVTDHHNVPNKLPKAAALVNPKLIKGSHPSQELSGAGVAFKFAWALFRLAGINDSALLMDMLDLVGLGTIADVVPLLDENRILATQGLSLINQRKRIGLRHLAEVAGLYGRISTKHVNFALAPRINAAGRLEHASLSVDLLLEEEDGRARELAEKLSKINSERQNIGGRIAEEADFELGKGDLDGTKFLMLSGSDWHPGVIGIVASKIVDKYYRPTILVGINDGEGRGSARSIDGFNIYELLERTGDLFLDFGGHEAAAGFKIKPENVPELKRRLEKEIENLIAPEELIPKAKIDAEINPNDITMGFIKELEALNPHGSANPTPIFLTRGLKLTEIRRLGSDGAHLKLKFSTQGTLLDTIGFRLGSLEERLSCGKSYDIAYSLGTNVWNGFETAELSLVDLREAG